MAKADTKKQRYASEKTLNTAVVKKKRSGIKNGHVINCAMFANASKIMRNWFLALRPDNYLQFTKVGTRKGMDGNMSM